MGTMCDCKTNWLLVRSPLEEMKYLLKFIFPFLHSGVEYKRGVEFCQSGERSVLTLGSQVPSAYPAMGHCVKIKNNVHVKIYKSTCNLRKRNVFLEAN